MPDASPPAPRTTSVSTMARLPQAAPEIAPRCLEVVDHRLLRRVRVAAGDGVENLLVVPVGGKEDPVDQAVDRHPHRRPRVLDCLTHQAIPGCVSYSQVEGVVRGPEPPGFAVLAHDVIGILQDGQILIGAPVCCQASRGTLHRYPVVEGLLDLGQLLCQQGTDALLVLGLVEDDDATACPAPADDVTLALQHADRFADGGPGHPKLVGGDTPWW